MKKLFRVTIELKIVVLAEDRFDAESVAAEEWEQAVRDGGLADPIISAFVKPIGAVTELPYNWSAGSLVYGDETETTIAEHLASIDKDALTK